ncbi:hypothetical protein RND71_032718 [Anisodus tanguticus]|uniref:Uncharacterized protein n=1 Tax=Anisodus tanguticus TaxID=243964 RepID=A0AAE1R6F3_9SOLA|nr:hypothetical protein RND71_032718 [Anisodus tanguticus]
MAGAMMMMKPSHNTTSTIGDSGFHRWNSPVPYLFGGLAIIMALIALALLIITCSYKKPSTEESSSSSNNVNDADQRQEKPSTKVVELMKPEMEPKFVVIMPGDYNPKWLAKPTMPHGPDQV